MHDFIAQIRDGMRVRGDYAKLAQAVEDLNAYVSATHSPTHALLLGEVAEFLAERPPWTMTALKAAVTLHESVEDPRWSGTGIDMAYVEQMAGEKIWQKAYEHLPDPNPHLRNLSAPMTKRSSPDKLDGILYTQKYTAGQGNALYDHAGDELKAYLGDQPSKRRQNYLTVMAERIAGHTLEPHLMPRTSSGGVTLAREISMDEIAEFASGEFKNWWKGQPEPPRPGTPNR